MMSTWRSPTWGPWLFRVVIGVVAASLAVSACGPIFAYDFPFSGAVLVEDGEITVLVVDCPEGSLESFTVYVDELVVWSIERSQGLPGLVMGPNIVELVYGERPDGYEEVVPALDLSDVSGDLRVEWQNTGNQQVGPNGFGHYTLSNGDVESVVDESRDSFERFSRRNCAATT